MKHMTYWAPLAWLRSGDVKGKSSVARNVRINVDQGTISEVTANSAPQRDDTRLDGLLIPGIANCHSHAFHRALRGLGDEGDTFFSWRSTMYRIAQQLTPEIYYEYAKAVYTEMMLAGYTTVAEFHYVHHQPDGTPYQDPNAMGKALIAAARDVGIRLTLLDACYLHSDVTGAPLNSEQRRFSDGSVQAWRRRVEQLESDVASSPGVRIGAAVHSVRACSLEEARLVSAWAASGDPSKVVHVHLSEQPNENEASIDHTGLTPTALLDAAGFWDEHSVAVHATHVNAHDIQVLADSGASVAMCPTTEADLADGIGPAAALRDAGVTLCIGSDENVCIDPFEEVRRLDGYQRLLLGRRDVFDTGELMDIMTAQGQRASGWPEAGVIVPGRLADFVVLNTSSIRTAGSSVERLPLVASGADVRDVVVGGRRIVSNGTPLHGAAVDVLTDMTRQLRDNGAPQSTRGDAA